MQEQQQDPNKAGLSTLEAALAASREARFATEGENEAKVKKMLAEAKKLLKALRNEEEDIIDDEFEVATAEQQFGMGPRALATNANITPDEQRQIDLATEQFKQAVTRVDNQVLAQYVQAIQDGDYAKAEAILEQAQESPQVNTLFFALLTIGAILLPLYAKQRLVALFTQFGMRTVFAETRVGKENMRKQAERGAKSHVRTIAKDIKKAMDDAIVEEFASAGIEATLKDKYEELIPLEGEKLSEKVASNKEMYEFARDLVLKGDSKRVIINKLQEKFQGIGSRRANVIAANEANRVFTMSQFDADQQFLAQNKLTQKAYKRLVSNTGHPEAICAYIIAQTKANPIPFTQDFVKFGSTITVEENGKTRKFTANYEKLQSGHIHVNCHCRYELLIKQDDGTFFNTYDMKVLNDVDFDETEHKRDKDGKFAKKVGVSVDVSDKGVLDITKIKDKESFNRFLKNSKQIYPTPEARAAKLYQSPHFYKINEGFQLNELSVKVNSETLSLDKFSRVLDKSFDIKTEKESVIYRGVGTFPEDFTVGEEYANEGYTSTTFVEETARKKFKAPGGAVLHLTIPAGTKISIPDLVSRHITKTDIDEQEAILPRGTSYKVTRIDGDIVYAELI